MGYSTHQKQTNQITAGTIIMGDESKNKKSLWDKIKKKKKKKKTHRKGFLNFIFCCI
jgi:hypothetical protein